MSVQSMVSLGRVGRILAGSIDASEMSVGKDAMLAQQQQRQQQQSSSRLAATAAAVTSPEAADKVSVNSSTTSSGGSKTGFQEPDVIASTKLAPSKSTDSVGRPMGPPPQPPAAAAAGPSGTNAPIPVAPPRRKKKSRKVSSSSSEQALPNEGLKLPANDKVSVIIYDITCRKPFPNSCSSLAFCPSCMLLICLRLLTPLLLLLCSTSKRALM